VVNHLFQITHLIA